MEKKIKFTFASMGTEIEVQLVTDKDSLIIESGKHLRHIEEIYERAMKIFSRFDGDSELSRLNSSLNEFTICSDWMQTIAERALEYNKQTEGMFDPRIINTLEKAGYDRDFRHLTLDTNADLTAESLIFKTKVLALDLLVKDDQIKFNHRMDFSGVVKGFITDETANYLKSQGWNNFLISSGGDIYAAGHDANEQFWYISVEGIPSEKMMLKLTNEAVATSGIDARKWEIAGKRMHHIINPHDSTQFSFDIKTLTVLAPAAEMADVWAKVLFLAGREKISEFADKYKLKYIQINYQGGVLISDLLKQNI